MGWEMQVLLLENYRTGYGKPACVYEADLSFLTCCMVLETWTMYQS